MELGHQEHLAVEFFNSLTIAYQNKTFKGKLLNTFLKFKKFSKQKRVTEQFSL